VSEIFKFTMFWISHILTQATGREVKLSNLFYRCLDVMNLNFFVDLSRQLLKVCSISGHYLYRAKLALTGHCPLGEAGEEATQKT